MNENLKTIFNEMQFFEEEHQYFIGNKELMSVSALISYYSPDFDRDKIAKKVSLKEGVSIEEILMRWNIRRDFSTVKGTEFHFYVYKYLTENSKMLTTTPIDKEISQFHDFWDNKNRSRYEVVATELMIYDKTLLIAGTVDCILRNKNDGKYYIMDWKTNRLIRKYNIYERFNVPLDHLDHCEYNKYCLQTSLYKAIIERNTNLLIEDSYLVHCSEDNENYNIINCSFLEKEIEAIFSLREKEL